MLKVIVEEETKIIEIDTKPNIVPKTVLGKIKFYLTIIIKRIFDIFCGILGLLLMKPLTIVIWALNKINKEEGPIFFSHTRIGKNG